VRSFRKWVFLQQTLREVQFAKQLSEEQLRARLEMLSSGHEAEMKAVKQLHAQVSLPSYMCCGVVG
jgi:glutamate-1-semialdehyde aminotransferase